MREIIKMERKNSTIRIQFLHEDDCMELFWEMVDRGRTKQSDIVADDYNVPKDKPLFE